MQTRLSMMLVQAGLATQDEIENIAREWGPGEVELAEAMVLRGQVTEELITEFLADIYSVDPIYLNETAFPDDAAKIIAESTAREHMVVPLERDGNTVSVAMAQPANMYAVDELKFATGCEIIVYASSPSAVRRALDEVYGRRDSLVSVESSLNQYDEQEDGLTEVASLDPGHDEDEITDDSLLTDKEEPIVKFVDKMIAEAVKTESSDIHIEPYEKYLRIRYRRDGTCHEVIRLPKAVQPSILSRLKILSGMNIAERRRTQDGRIKAKVDNRIIDFRVNAVPTVNGEKIVLRILDRGNLEFDLRQLGFPEDALKKFMAGVSSPFGIVLVTGPTGSGKTTTLYSALSSLNVPAVNIHHRGRPRRIQHRRNYPDPDRPRDGVHFRNRSQKHPQAGPEHHHGRRDPRPRNGIHRHKGIAHGPPRFLHDPHERCPQHHQPPGGHRDQAVPGGERGSNHHGPETCQEDM